MRRLYLQIYLALVGALLVFALLLSSLFYFRSPREQEERMLSGVSELLGESLPVGTASQAEIQQAVTRLGKRLRARVTLRSPTGELIASHGRPLSERTGEQIRRPGGRRSDRHTVSLILPDGRRLLLRHRPRRPRAPWNVIVPALLLVTAAGVYPVIRRLTGRLERLRTRVDALAKGDLAARVAVEGDDEVAALARSFNRAAERIEQLVGGQRALLAMASHELRSPLARLRVALELLAREADTELKTQIETDITELDELIDELLLASRLEAAADPNRSEPVDLYALAATECARFDASIHGEPLTVNGDPRLLQRLVRNLLDNARRHGGGSAVEVNLQRTDNGFALLHVDDAGPGIPENERERVFAPFYRRAGTSEGVHGGVGLGLHLVREIARRHGGDAVCLARPGGGSRFEVRLRT